MNGLLLAGGAMALAVALLLWYDLKLHRTEKLYTRLLADVVLMLQKKVTMEIVNDADGGTSLRVNRQGRTN